MWLVLLEYLSDRVVVVLVVKIVVWIVVVVVVVIVEKLCLQQSGVMVQPFLIKVQQFEWSRRWDRQKGWFEFHVDGFC